MEIVNIKIGKLKPYDKNAKKHDQTQIDNVAESIKQFGMVQPVVIDSHNVVIIGHCRLEACKKLGMEEVAVVITGKHACMTARGVKNKDAVTRTASLSGAFKTNSSLRNEFYQLLKE